MAKKYYDGMKMSKGFSNLPANVIQKSYPKKDYAIMEGGYIDTQPELDREASKNISKVKKMQKK